VDTVHECDRRTDRRTDGQMDRITITKTVQTASHGKNHKCILFVTSSLPLRVCDITRIEKVQMKATKYMCRIKHLSYEDRLRNLKLPTLNYRRIRGDMIELYKIITGKYDSNFSLQLYLRSDTVQASINKTE